MSDHAVRTEGPAVRRAQGPPPERLPPQLREIADAYHRYWQAKSAAYLTMDPAPLGRAMAGSGHGGGPGANGLAGSGVRMGRIGP
jgi:hypothetical protein